MKLTDKQASMLDDWIGDHVSHLLRISYFDVQYDDAFPRKLFGRIVREKASSGIIDAINAYVNDAILEIADISLGDAGVAMNPGDMLREAGAGVRAVEPAFAEVFDDMRVEISDRVGYDVTGGVAGMIVDDMLADELYSLTPGI